MANCNKLFLDFNTTISLSKAQREKLDSSKTAIQDKIRNHFKDKEDIKNPKFRIQGSVIMKTVIIKKDKTYDVDIGVFFLEKPNVTSTTAQKHVLEAVANHTKGGQSHHKKCIRVIYADDFNIDLPVYYIEEDDDHPHLAVKNEDWQLSDPKELCEWFESKKDKKGQMKRLVKYLKVWANNRSFKMPSGIALSVWAANKYAEDERDDIALSNLLDELYNTINKNCDCYNPSTPFDNLTSKLDDNQKDKFHIALEKFKDDAQEAITSTNQQSASKLWINHLGDRFPLGVDEDVDAKQKELNKTKASILSGTARTDESGTINTEKGIEHKPHKNYGA
jgi:hypothetical protein